MLGVIISSGEFRHHTATLTYLATPARDRVLAAKLVAGFIAGAIFGLVAYAITLTDGLAFTAGRGDHLLISAATLTNWGFGPRQWPWKSAVLVLGFCWLGGWPRESWRAFQSS